MTESINLHIMAELTQAFENCFELNNFANTGAVNANDIKNMFRPILEKWHTVQDTSGTPAMPLIAYVLPGGNQSNNNQGIAGLTPTAANIVHSLVPVAGSLRFSLFTASLIKKVVGIPHEDHFSYEFIPSEHKRRCLGLDAEAYDAFCESKRHGPRFHENPMRDYYRYRLDDYDTPPIGDVLQEKLLLYDLTSVDGSNALTFDIGKVRIKGPHLIAARNEFAGSYPQRDNFNRDSGEIGLEYHRAVVVLSPLQKETALCIALKGPFWTLGLMRAPSAPNPRAMDIISAVMERLDAKRASMPLAWLKGWTASHATIVLSHAMVWNDPALWNRATRYCQMMLLRHLLPAARQALEVFEVELIKDGLISLMKTTGTLAQRFKLIDAVAYKCQKVDEVVTIDELKRLALSLCTRPTLQDIPILVSATQATAPETILFIISNIEKRGTYEPLMALAKALYGLHQSPTTPASDRVHLMNATRQFISSAASQWEYIINVETPHEWSESDATTRMCDIIVFCYKLNHPQPYVDLLNVLCQHKCKSDAQVISQLRQIHAPLAIHLRATLARLGISPALVYEEPFASFARDSISQYLARALPPKVTLPPLPAKAFGCGCADCTRLDDFVRGSGAVMYYKASQRRRSQVEAQILQDKGYLEHYVTTKTEEYGSPYTLCVRKRNEVMAAMEWRKQRNDAETFVRCVCPDEQSLREVMGGRYDDVMSALEGTGPFGLGDLEFAGEVSRSTPQSQKVSDVSVIGTKRKHI